MSADGPDRIIPTENFVTTKPDGCVKIRESTETNNKLDPMSLVTYTKNQVHCQTLFIKIFPLKQACTTYGPQAKCGPLKL